MTTVKKEDRRAAELGSGQGSISNEGGTATGPGKSPGTKSHKENQRNIAGAGSDKALNSRPGHKVNA
jgi:hypothetical protein